MKIYRSNPRLREFLVEHGALPNTMGFALRRRTRVDVAQIHETGVNIVTQEDARFVLLAEIEIENSDDKRVRVDEVWLEMSWGERVSLFPDPRTQNPKRNFYSFGGLTYARELVINHRICKGRYLVGHHSRVDGLLFGVIESCPPASLERILTANLTLVFSNGSASHTRLLLANSNIYKRPEDASATRGVVAHAPTSLGDAENHDA
jgi:hypothetical protein